MAREVEPVAVSRSVCPFAEFVSCAGGDAGGGDAREMQSRFSLQVLS